MTVDRRRIWEAVFEHQLESEFKSADTFLAADRSDLVCADGLNSFLNTIEQKLGGLDPRKIHATKNIVLELAGNTLLHGPKDGTSPELLLLARHRAVVTVWMFGSGRKSQIQRLNQIIKRISGIAEPPHHRRQLLKRRNNELLRKSASPPSKERGGGTGMMTIAALSSKPLDFRPKYGVHEASCA